jgi:hypothetical protein
MVIGRDPFVARCVMSDAVVSEAVCVTLHAACFNHLLQHTVVSKAVRVTLHGSRFKELPLVYTSFVVS